jgi:hypothetical protein
MPITMTTPQYTVNADNLTIRDIIAIQNANGDIGALMPIYAKCIELPEGMDVLDLPAKHLKAIAQAIVKEMTADMGN